MTLAEAKILREALDRAIAKAEFAGASHVDLSGELSADLGAALSDLGAAIADKEA
ncbi:MAG: hypothetical protein U1F09_13165 [Steroidobacteraceae bacterium]